MSRQTRVNWPFLAAASLHSFDAGWLGKSAMFAAGMGEHTEKSFPQAAKETGAAGGLGLGLVRHGESNDGEMLPHASVMLLYCVPRVQAQDWVVDGLVE